MRFALQVDISVGFSPSAGFRIVSVKTFDLFDDAGRLHAFEVSNLWLGRRGVVKIVRTIPGVTVLKVPQRMFSWRTEDEFCKFAVCGRQFTVEEPFGDNSRYLIASEPPGWCPELQTVHKAFATWRGWMCEWTHHA